MMRFFSELLRMLSAISWASISVCALLHVTATGTPNGVSVLLSLSMLSPFHDHSRQYAEKMVMRAFLAGSLIQDARHGQALQIWTLR
jgi:hypothetical protein